MSYFVTNTEKKQHHTEGDVWEEGGKTWTIKNGIKKTLGKMDAFRRELVMPLGCPHCGKPMKSEINKPLWAVYKRCLDCVVDMEHEIAKQGKWKEYQDSLYKANAQSRFNDLEQFLKDFMQIGADSFVTEDGNKEHWVDNTKGTAEKLGNEILTNYKKEIDKLDGTSNDKLD